jgi:hypothetical protein
MAMLDDNPVLKERVMALGAFTGIAMFAVAAVDVMVTGGFDFAPGRAASEQRQPSAYVRVVDAAQYMSDRVRSISWDEPAPIGEANAATSEDLVGGDDGSSLEAYAEADLYQEIGTLYEQSEPEQAYVEEPSYEDALAYDAEQGEEFSPEEAEELAIASGNASPW